MATFRVLAGKCVVLDGVPPQSGRAYVAGETFDGDPEKLQHLLTGGSAELVTVAGTGSVPPGDAEVESDPLPTARPEAVAPPAGQSPKVKVGRRQE